MEPEAIIYSSSFTDDSSLEDSTSETSADSCFFLFALELLFIFSSGGVGIDTTSPFEDLHCAQAPDISSNFCALSDGCAPLSSQDTAFSTFISTFEGL
jgi:hypothetical protein